MPVQTSFGVSRLRCKTSSLSAAVLRIGGVVLTPGTEDRVGGARTPIGQVTMRAPACQKMERGDQTTRRKNLSGERIMIFPRCLRMAPDLCHSLTMRLVV